MEAKRDWPRKEWMKRGMQSDWARRDEWMEVEKNREGILMFAQLL